MFDPDGKEPNICYTIGNCHHGLPELVLFGLPVRQLQVILNDACAQMRAGELQVGDRVVAKELLVGYDAVFRRANPDIAREKMNVLRAYCKRKGIVFPEVLQLVFPDVNSRFPWDEGCDAKIREIQPQWYATEH